MEQHLSDLETLFAKIAHAMKKILAASGFRKKVFIEEQKAQNENGFLRGRQIAYMICDFFRATGTAECVGDLSDLMGVTLR